VLSRLGTSGANESFLALIPDATGPSRRVVIERLLPELARDPDFVAVFLEEARLSLRLRHPSLVQSHEIGWHDGGYYLASEHVSGQSLEDVLKGTAPVSGLELPLALEVLSSVLGALDYAHNQTDRGTPLNVVHRRVSPANVFITHAGTVKLGRCGVAASVPTDRRTEAGLADPPLWYCAPEQLRGGTVDRRADVYAVGVMLWEMAARRPLWAGLPEVKRRHWVRAGKPAPVLDGPGVPPELVPVAARALATDPDDRYATAGELQADLAQILTVTPLSRAEQLADVVMRVREQKRPYQPRPPSTPPPVPSASVPPASIEGAPRHTPMVLSDVDDDAATRVRQPPPLRRRPSAWWLVAAAMAVAGAVFIVAGAGRRPPPPPLAALPEAPAEQAPPPAPPAPPSRAVARRRSSAGAARRKASDRPVNNAGASEGPEALALGQQALLGGELRLAEQELRRALLFDPASGEALAGLASVQFERARYKDALLLAERAVRGAPDNAKYLVLLGDICVKVGLVGDAAAAYARARVLRPDDVEIRARFDRAARAAASGQQ
jgi:serine/threonine-protein kinase